MANSSRTWIIAGIAAAVLLLIGVLIVVCLGAGWFAYQRGSSPSLQQVTVEVTREIILIPTQVLAASATATFAATPPTLAAPTAAPTLTPAPATIVPNVVYQNLSFWLDEGLASGTSPVTVPANPPVPDGPYWDIYPQYIEINLTGYVLPDTFHKPRISVYPATAFEQMSDQAKEVIANMRNLLKDRPSQVDQIPSLPVWNAGQVFHARLHYLEFSGGSGVAFLTEYAQNFAPINNHDLFYNFQGLTNDGRYYIVAILPASHPKLIPNAEISQDEFEELANDYQGYLDQIIPMLESQPATSFHPSLADLDALIQSIEVQ